MLFLSAILALPITKQVFSVLQEVQQDGQKLQKKLPDFSIENGTLQTKAKESGFIYQTDSIILRLIQMENVQPLMSKRI